MPENARIFLCFLRLEDRVLPMRYSLNLAHKIAKGALFLSRKIEDMENLSSKTTLNYTALQNYVLIFLGRSLE